MRSLLKLYGNLKKYWFLIIPAIIFIYLQVRANLELPTIMMRIVNDGILPGDINYIWQQGMFMLVIAGLGILASIAANFLASHASMGLGRDIRSKLFRHVESFSLSEFSKFGASTLLTRTSNDVVQIQQSTQMLIMMLSNAIFTGIDALILAYNASPYLTRVLFVAIPIIALVIAIFIKPITTLFLLIQKEIDKINKVVRENITGVRVIRAFNKIDYEKKRFDNANLDVTNTYIKANRIMAVLMPLAMISMNLATVAIIWYGAKGIDLGNTNLGSMVAFIQYAMMILMSIVFLTILFVMLPRAVAASERVVEVLETPIEIKDPETPKAFPDERKGNIQFIDVSFKYIGAEEPVLHNITFEAKPGEVVGILGTTGSGKTTLVNLIPRLYDVTSGRLLIDGIDVRDVPQEELRKRISYVPQRAVIFTGTIKENIKMGKPDATDEEIIEAAKIAQAHGFIERLPQGYDTIISEGGTNLSGGQKQRISIARGILRRGDIFVFDDCFSALDFKTEAKLRAALKDIIKNSTVILVAQRVASVMNADKIVVLDEGRIVGIGNHKELMETSEVYREIVFSQLSQEDLVREGLV
ncbi:MAG: ABC transporter ATP-binding protein [Caldisericum exile]|uniref:ABC transporter ATP-binding protein n=1 Tax=Caldisericum exile TaxID=693075 RepID=UPI003C76174E